MSLRSRSSSGSRLSSTQSTAPFTPVANSVEDYYAGEIQLVEEEDLRDIVEGEFNMEFAWAILTVSFQPVAFGEEMGMDMAELAARHKHPFVKFLVRMIHFVTCAYLLFVGFTRLTRMDNVYVMCYMRTPIKNCEEITIAKFPTVHEMVDLAMNVLMFFVFPIVSAATFVLMLCCNHFWPKLVFKIPIVKPGRFLVFSWFTLFIVFWQSMIETAYLTTMVTSSRKNIFVKGQGVAIDSDQEKEVNDPWGEYMRHILVTVLHLALLLFQLPATTLTDYDYQIAREKAGRNVIAEGEPA